MGGSHRESRRRSRGALAGVARSLGSAAGWVRRLGRRSKEGASEPERESAPLQLFQSLVRGRQDTPVLVRLRQRRAELGDDIAGLRDALEDVHAAIGSGVRPDGAGRGPAALQARIREARRLREDLHERELELARIDRHIAREEQLRDLGVHPRDPERAGDRTSRQAAEERDGDDADLAKRRRAVRDAVRAASFEDRVERARIERLAEQLCDADEETRRNAAKVIAGLGVPVAQDLLVVAVNDRSERVRLTALNALARTEGPAAEKVFRRFLDDDDVHVRTAALRGLDAHLSGGELVAALEDPEPEVRKTAATMLGWRASADAVSGLSLALRDGDATVRRAAADALGNLADHRGVLALIRALRDEDPGTRAAADRALLAAVGPEIRTVGEGLPDADRIAALKRWWETARVDKTLERMGLAPPGATDPAHPGVEPEAAEPAPALDALAAEEAPPAPAPSEPAAVDEPEPAVEEVAAVFEETPDEPEAEEEVAAVFEETPDEPAVEDLIGEATGEAEDEDYVDLGLGAEEAGDSEQEEGFESLFGEGEASEGAPEKGDGGDEAAGEEDEDEEYESIM